MVFAAPKLPNNSSLGDWNLPSGSPRICLSLPVARAKCRAAKPQLLHVRDDVVAELGALDFRRAFHLARKVEGDALAADRAVQSFED